MMHARTKININTALGLCRNFVRNKYEFGATEFERTDRIYTRKNTTNERTLSDALSQFEH